MGIRILLADDHAIVREGFRSLLEKESDLEVIAEAENGRKAVQLARELTPDIVIMDISMPYLNGIEAARQIVAGNPRIKVISLSVHNDKRYIKEMLRAGISGYLLKKGAFQELILAIQTVLRNQVYLSPGIADVVVDDYLHGSSSSADSMYTLLSDREREILQLIAEGKSSKEIAHHLHLSIKTVSTHRQSILEKLHIDNLADLVKYTIREGLISLESS